ncbi:MAG: discoidin domain-containing protein, partial [Lentisphaeria bacterium]|nr:discoidin domain-containing protein [Lentisphaeria bacterium]
EEHGHDPWYYRMHYADLDRVPEAAGRSYTFRPAPLPARTDRESFLDVTAPPFQAAGDGRTDDTAAIAGALDAAGRAGGGTVYLPQGEYRVTAPLTVPTGVELRGPLGQGRVREFRETCSLAGIVGKGTARPDTAPALLTLMPHAGVRGFTIVFPEQSHDVAALVPFPYAIRGAGPGIWIVDMHLLNATFGIDLATHRCDDHLVRDLWGTAFYRGIHVGGGSRAGRLERVAFSWGPWAEPGRLHGIATPESRKALARFSGEHSVHYTFGDCQGQKAWGLVGFYPRLHCHFVAENGRSCRDAEFWLSMHDVACETCLKLDAGGQIELLGYFATGGRDGIHNWFETGPDFRGPLIVYGKTIERTFVNHPIRAAPERVRFHNEASRTFGRTATATDSAPDSDPQRALDRDPRTWWEAPGGALLDVDLGQVLVLDRVAVEGAGRFIELALNTVRAELLVSRDGRTFAVAARLEARPGGQGQSQTHSWVDVPILPPVPARYVRLRVTDPGADGTIRVASFDLFGVPE